MKIGLLTYHNTLNFGAALQTYSLLRALKKLGSEPEVINYRNPELEKATSVWHSLGDNPSIRGRVKKLLQVPFMSLKRRAFEDFNKRYLQVSETIYTSSSQIQHSPPEYDLYLVGSDQVWNYDINGLDSTYFLDFVKDRTKTATYASSFGLSKIPVKFQSAYSEGIRSINSISVREELGAELVRELTGRESSVNPDPVFLTTPEEWIGLSEKHNTKAVNGGLVSYFLGADLQRKAVEIIKDSELRTLREMKLAGGLQIQDLFSTDTSVRLDRGPFDFVQCIHQASFVITGSFHATAFAILLDKPFAVILKGDAGKDSRIKELLQTFGLENRAVTSSNQLNFEAPSNEASISTVLEELRKTSFQYLESIV